MHPYAPGGYGPYRSYNSYSEPYPTPQRGGYPPHSGDYHPGGGYGPYRHQSAPQPYSPGGHRYQQPWPEQTAPAAPRRLQLPELDRESDDYKDAEWDWALRDLKEKGIDVKFIPRRAPTDRESYIRWRLACKENARKVDEWEEANGKSRRPTPPPHHTRTELDRESDEYKDKEWDSAIKRGIAKGMNLNIIPRQPPTGRSDDFIRWRLACDENEREVRAWREAKGKSREPTPPPHLRAKPVVPAESVTPAPAPRRDPFKGSDMLSALPGSGDDESTPTTPFRFDSVPPRRGADVAESSLTGSTTQRTFLGPEYKPSSDAMPPRSGVDVVESPRTDSTTQRTYFDPDLYKPKAANSSEEAWTAVTTKGQKSWSAATPSRNDQGERKLPPSRYKPSLWTKDDDGNPILKCCYWFYGHTAHCVVENCPHPHNVSRAQFDHFRRSSTEAAQWVAQVEINLAKRCLREAKKVAREAKKAERRAKADEETTTRSGPAPTEDSQPYAQANTSTGSYPVELSVSEEGRAPVEDDTPNVIGEQNAQSSEGAEESTEDEVIWGDWDDEEWIR
ncbi:uncharacterized protein BKA78DRAFT_299097 [Phyllosticta capitalensis]|uniref:uncharacterized protein n=1 Tax=Phyllosticta capitalensis TaxID=121624 RepID=UPI00312F67DA